MLAAGLATMLPLATCPSARSSNVQTAPVDGQQLQLTPAKQLQHEAGSQVPSMCVWITQFICTCLSPDCAASCDSTSKSKPLDVPMYIVAGRSTTNSDMAAKTNSIAYTQDVEPRVFAAVHHTKWLNTSFVASPIAKLFVLWSMTHKHLPCEP